MTPPTSSPVACPRLDDAQVQAVHGLVARAEDADGVAPLNEESLLHLGEPGSHLLVTGTSGLVGYGRTDGESAELVISPAERRQGYGLALGAALLAAGPSASFWAHGSLPGTGELAAGLGLGIARELLLMGRDLVDLPERPMPAGTTLRAFEVGRDEDAWLTLNASAFAEHPEQGSWSAEDLALRIGAPWFDPSDLLLAERDGALVASHWTKMIDGASAGAEPGEVYVVAVDPEAQGGGLGSAILLAGLTHLQRRGARQVVLYVDADNAAAVHVYERWGFTTLSTDTAWSSLDDTA